MINAQRWEFINSFDVIDENKEKAGKKKPALSFKKEGRVFREKSEYFFGPDGTFGGCRLNFFPHSGESAYRGKSTHRRQGKIVIRRILLGPEIKAYRGNKRDPRHD